MIIADPLIDENKFVCMVSPRFCSYFFKLFFRLTFAKLVYNGHTFSSPGYPMQIEQLLSRYQSGERDFSKIDLSGVDLSNVDLSGSDLSLANLKAANLSRANLRGTNLSGAILQKANLSQADLTKANLNMADLGFANLSNANLSGASMQMTILFRAKLTGALMPK